VTYHDSLAWRRALADLEQARREDGDIPTSIGKAIAQRLGITDRQLRRRLQAQAAGPPVERTLTDEHLAYLARYGTGAVAHDALVRDGLFEGSLSTFRRRVEAVNLAIYRGTVEGDEGAREAFAYLRWEAPEPNDTWQQDTIWANVTVLDGRTPINPVIEFIVDDCSRNAMVGLPWPKAPDAEMAATAVAMAVSGKFTPGGEPARPKRIRHDQAAYYVGSHYTLAVAAAGIEPVAVPGRSPHLKGKGERFNRTVRVEFLRSLPGSFLRPMGLAEDEQALRHDPRDRLLTLEEFHALLDKWLRWYNEARPHSSLGGRTPAEVYRAGARPEAVNPRGLAMLRRRPSEQRTISKNGLRWDGRDYTHPVFTGRAGTLVEVGPVDGDPGKLEVYLEGEWWCTAELHKAMQDRAEEFYQERARISKRTREIRRRASELRSDGVPTVEQRDDVDHESLIDDLIDEDLAR
jgi:putative transposase